MCHEETFVYTGSLPLVSVVGEIRTGDAFPQRYVGICANPVRSCCVFVAVVLWQRQRCLPGDGDRIGPSSSL